MLTHLHNKQVLKEYHKVNALLEMMRDQLEDELYDYSNEPLMEADEKWVAERTELSKELGKVNEAIEVVEQWAIQLGGSIHGGNF